MTPARELVAYLQDDAVITAQATGGIWLDTAPQKTSPPIVLVMQGQAPVVGKCAGTTLVSLDVDLAVWCLGRTGQVDALDTLHAQVQALLTGQRWPTSAAWRVMGSQYIEQYEKVQLDGTDTRWHALGALYRVRFEQQPEGES